ncbi:cytochrome b-c1 complex subunit 2, mitochondrial-like [Mizuhopecten yessoensis]|uniref:Cytochrome b-c1 complex subunit 2, mitochondrial n=1 Tax=Mizuhopecten yessoensis TaxID=6573 RepID=A0A210QM53_MIZYE|nr:cytochrome b-c1 complex subunit 2, mitochondrial-like [Mizuhopecten yessoensis]OWF49812.1 Cytochrome b-c1 complex subunit 2, mitochondrial [Mizuhopecten yessoensis]
MLSTRAARSVARSLKGQVRFYAVPKPSEDIIPHANVPKFEKEPQKVTKLENGLTVASIENASPISKVGIAVKAGARYESAGYEGTTHFLRNALALSTASTHGVSVVREIQKNGCNMRCAANREYLFYQVEGTRDTIEAGIDIMTMVVTEPLYLKHEMKTVTGLVDFDLKTLQPEALLMEDLHAAAFKGGLSNSIHCPSYNVDNIKSEMMHAYRLSLFKEPRMAFVGIGVDANFMLEKAKQIPASLNLLGTAVENTSKYVGGESRHPTGGDLTYASLVTEGPGLTSKDAASAAVLQYVMGVGPSVKYSPGLVSRLGKAVHSAMGNDNFAISAVNLPYSDTGLFGFSVAGNASDMETIMQAAAKEFAAVTKSGAISDQAVTSAKNQLKAAIHMDFESTASIANHLAVESLMTDKPRELGDLLTTVDSVSAADVANVAKKIINGKPTMACRGNLSWTPRLVDLM